MGKINQKLDSAALVRFISEDPAGFSGGINLYAYTGGNPVSYVDPNGENPVLIVGIIAHYGRNVFNDTSAATKMVDQHGSTTNGFDALDRLTSHTDPNGHTVQYAYDQNSNITQLTYPDGKTVSYSYDNLNRISDVNIDWLNKNAAPNYDAAGRLTGITHFNDTSTTYQFDDASRLTGLTHYKSNNQTLADYQYTLDANGNRTQAIITNEPILPAAMINAAHSKTFNTQ